MQIDENKLLEGDPLTPDRFDLTVQIGSLPLKHPIPDGWRVLTGNNFYSKIARVAYRYQIEEGL